MLKPSETAPKKLTRRDLSLNRLENFKREFDTDNHTIPLAQLCKRLDTDLQLGLSSEQAKTVLAQTGPNTLTPSHRTPEYVKFFKTLFSGFSILLWIGSVLCGAAVWVHYESTKELDLDNSVLGSVLALLVILTGAFMYYQEHKSSQIMDSFRSMVPLKATVIRDGKKQDVLSKDVVVGDLVDLKYGDRIPADVRIVQCQGFKVDNSCLTGETEPQVRSHQTTNPNPLESPNMAFFSTNAVEGLAQGVVIACGDNTVMGRIAGLTARLKPNKTPIARELEYFMQIVSIWACFLGVTIGVLAVTLGYSWLEAALFLIGIIVANVPEGLQATVTVCLTVTAKRMANRKCLVKNLEAVETLGCTSTICSDKTGTLTQNRMSVCTIWVNSKTFSSDLRELSRYKNDEAFRLLMRCATLCNRAEFEPGSERLPIEQREVKGDASEVAILKFVETSQIFGNSKTFKDKNPKLIEIPFTSATKIQLSVHALQQEGTCLLVLKGAPERVLESCDSAFVGQATAKLNDQLLAVYDRACTDLAAKGQRVFGFADLDLDQDRFTRTYPYSIEPPNFPRTGLRFLGFLALIDPPRPQVKDSIGKCRMAGIKVIMVTGDHPMTAKSIATDVGIITALKVSDATTSEATPLLGERAIVVHGTSLREMSKEELDDIIYRYKEIVFARTSPTQKLQIVESCQRLGEVVAVTGDGVNDAPALKKADVGISMGITGTEVSKQSADIILLDDNFSTIILGIEEGRRIFDNLKKSIVYVLASNIAEIVPFLMYIILSIPLPLGIIAILCIDLLTDMLPAISLAYEDAETDIMMRPPRNPRTDHLVNRKLYFLAFGYIGVFEAMACHFVYFMVMAEHGFMPQRLIGLRKSWESNQINNLIDSYGQEWTYEERKRLEYTCYTAVMISVVVTQWADLIACKTRLNSICTQGMNNWVLNFSLIAETVIACILSYAPYMNYLKFYPVLFRWWLYAVPFAVFIVAFDEFRKWHIRNYPLGYFRRETYY